MDKLPKGWDYKRFGDIVYLRHGYQFRQFDFTESGIPVVKIGQCKENGTLDLTGCDFVSDSRINEFQDCLIKRGDLLMALTGGTLGKVTLVDKDYGTVFQNYRVGNFFPNESFITKSFTRYVLLSDLFQNLVKSKVNQGAQPNIGKENIDNMIIPLPPLSEQTRIVNKLDALFSRIDKSIALLEENINYTKASLASVIEDIFNFTTKRIQIYDLVEKTKNINPTSQQSIIYNYIDISSINNEKHKIEETKQISGKEAPSRARKHVIKGDVLFATTRPNLKNIALLEQDYENAVASTGFCVLRVNKGVSNNFLYLCLLSNNIQDQIKPKIRGAQYPAISDKDLFNCFIPDLELETQIKLSNRILKARLLLMKLLIEQQSKLTYLKALKASILDKAFKGEL